MEAYPRFTSTDASQAFSEQASLMNQLNILLMRLNLPIPLMSPTDLTPSLLIAILESFLDRRIPVVHTNEDPQPSKALHVQNMKIFLGVLETEILQMDVGLSDVDPRKLAAGEFEEVVFIGELLCWIGRRIGLLPTRKRTDKMPLVASEASTPVLPKVASLSLKPQPDLNAASLFQTNSTTTAPSTSKGSRSTLSPFRCECEETITSLTTLETTDNSSELSSLSPFNPNYDLPRCIHEIPSPSLLFTVDDEPPSSPPKQRVSGRPEHPKSLQDSSIRLCDCDPSIASILPVEHDHTLQGHAPVPIRRSGYLEPVNEELELASFESNRSLHSVLNNSSSSLTPKERSVKLDAVKKQYERTLALLSQRAALLAELARLQHEKVTPLPK